MKLIKYRAETGSTCFSDIQCLVCLALKVVYRRSVIPPHTTSSKTHNPGSCSTKHGIGAELKLPASKKKPQSFFFFHPGWFFSCSSVVLLDACILGISSLIDLVMGRSEQRRAMERSSHTHTVYPHFSRTNTHIHNLPSPCCVTLVLFRCYFASKSHKRFRHKVTSQTGIRMSTSHH